MAGERLKDIIRADKTDIEFSAWGVGKLKSRDFPMSKKPGQRYPMTARWRWQIISFSACGRKFRLLTSYHTLIPEFAAVLAEDTGRDSRILARWEFHLSHGGWHIHPVCDELDAISPGMVKPAGMMRLPSAASHFRRKLFLNKSFAMDDTVATAIACRRFRISHNEDIFAQSALSCH